MVEGNLWYWISTHYACFGIEEKNGIVTTAAPIARWTIGKKIEDVINYFKQKGAEIKELS